MKKYLLVLLTVLTVLIPALAAAQSSEPDFGGVAQFRNRWIEQDRLVGSSGVTRPFTWGPGVPGAPSNMTESYENSPGGNRRVLYLDKARMEINNPVTGFVTAGLLVKELVSGQRQDGDNKFSAFAPSETQVAGDPVSVNAEAPVYRSFRNLVTLGNADDKSKPAAIGSSVNAFLSKEGTVTTITAPEAITIGAYHDVTGHNVAKPFADFFNITGPVTDPLTGTTIQNQPIYTVQPISNVFGYAISEPYWVSTKIAGTPRLVLVQLFERRVLTYNPAITGASKVEMGNLGQHYYNWRYREIGNATTTPPPTTTVPVTTTPAILLNDYTQARANYNKSNDARPVGGASNTQNYGAGSVISGSAAVDLNKKLAVFGTNNNGLHGINIDSLASIFIFKPSPVISFNTAAEILSDTVYIGGSDGRVYAIDTAAIGTSVTEKGKTAGSGAAVEGLAFAPDGNRMYYTAGGSIFAVDTANLTTQRWTDAPGGTLSAPAVDKDGSIFVGSSNGKLYGYNPDGTKLANFNGLDLGGVLDDSPTLANGFIYVGSDNGNLYKVNKSNATRVWTTAVEGSAIIDTVPAFAGGFIYVGTDGGKVHKISDNNGSVSATFTAGGAVRSSVAVMDGFYYFGDDSGKLYKVDVNSTANSTQLATGAGLFGYNNPVVAGGRVFVGASDASGKFYIVK
jgi:outer membrane protein assembly factor BamB